MKKRLLSIIIGTALVIGVTAIPAQVASASSLGKLTVQLVDLKGKPIHLKNVQLALTNKGEETDWSTNSKGLANFYSVGASSSYVVSTVTATKYAPAKKSHIVVKAGHTTHAKLTLAVGGTISGVVQNSDGQHPIDITVQVLDMKTETVVASLLTNSVGHYQTPGLPTGKYTVYYNYGSERADEYPRLGVLSQGPVSITQHTTKHAAVSKKHYDATLTTLIKLSGTTNQVGATSISAWNSTGDFVLGEYDFRPATSGSSTSFELYLPEGTYRVTADIADVNSVAHYWYVNNGAATSSSKAASATVSLTDDTTIVVQAHG